MVRVDVFCSSTTTKTANTSLSLPSCLCLHLLMLIRSIQRRFKRYHFTRQNSQTWYFLSTSCPLPLWPLTFFISNVHLQIRYIQCVLTKHTLQLNKVILLLCQVTKGQQNLCASENIRTVTLTVCHTMVPATAKWYELFLYLYYIGPLTCNKFKIIINRY